MRNYDNQAIRAELFAWLARQADETLNPLRRVSSEVWEAVFNAGFKRGWQAGQERIREMEEPGEGRR